MSGQNELPDSGRARGWGDEKSRLNGLEGRIRDVCFWCARSMTMRVSRARPFAKGRLGLTGGGFSEISRASRRLLDVKIAGDAAKTGSLSLGERAGVRGGSATPPVESDDPPPVTITGACAGHRLGRPWFSEGFRARYPYPSPLPAGEGASFDKSPSL